MRRVEYGYCAVTADFLHIGHIRFIKKCAKRCRKLIIGVMTDECVKKYKGKKPIMTFSQRKEIIDSLKFTFKSFAQDTFDFPHAIIRMKLYYGKDMLIFDSEQHDRIGTDISFPYMNGISSTLFKHENINNS